MCHYLINNKDDIYPFEKGNLRRDINLWKKYNDDNIIYLIGHLHNSFDINEVDGIVGDYIEDDGTLTNIVVADSCGCRKDEYTFYIILGISKDIKYKTRKVKYDRDKFVNKVLSHDFPDKRNILKYFYGIEI